MKYSGSNSQSMMKIIVVCTSSYVYGAEVATLNLLEGLKKEGHDILAITSTWTDGEFSKRLAELAISEKRLPFGTFSKKLTWQAISWTFNMLIRLPGLWFGWSRIFRHFQPDILIITNPKHGLYLYHWLDKVPSIIIEHSEKPISKENRWLYNILMKRLAGVVAVSHYLVANIRQLGVASEKIHVIYNGIFSAGKKQHIDALPQRKTADSANPFKIGIVGQISPHKGHDCLLQATRLMNEKNRNFEVLVFGSGNPDYIAKLKHDLALANADSIWQWKGYESRHDHIYPQFDICVVPSQCDEAFGMTAVEASAYGLPVVASRRGGLQEAVEEGVTGLLFESGNAQELADKIMQLMDSLDNYRQMSVAAQKRAFEVFSIEESARRFSALLKTLARHV